MTPWVRQYIPVEEIALFEKVRRAVIALPDVDLGSSGQGEKIILSCHMLARAVGEVFSLKHVDGYLYPAFRHRWNLTPKGHVIDVYPVATMGGPLLIDGKCYLARKLYLEEDPPFMDEVTDVPWFQGSVDMIVDELRKLVPDEVPVAAA